jgi:hypothetical protein
MSAPRSPMGRPLVHDDALTEFQSLVDCRPEEVLDVATKPAVSLTATSSRKFDPSKFSARTMPYGKHKGVSIGEVPKQYLRWLADAPSTIKGSARFKADLRKWLSSPLPPLLDNALSREYRSIVGKPDRRTA